MFGNIYQGKRVLITGHTGFKGAWLSAWLMKLGAGVAGYADGIPTQPSLFESACLGARLEHHLGDVRDLRRLREVMDGFRPDFVFHLAAQAIVSTSYKSPVDTITTNVLGTVNLLEALRQVDYPCVAVLITSDKCYENVEWAWGYKETDHLGGKDVYSGSKGAAEVLIHSYLHSFFQSPGCSVRLATGRAGNVIGGGDWARDRIVVDCMRSWASQLPVKIRSPLATRPWQHVLEPLSGYLTLGAALHNSAEWHGESFNFGPKAEQSHTVLKLLKDLSTYWDFQDEQAAFQVVDEVPFHEAGLLKLNCDKANFHLKWESNLAYKECVQMVAEWYYQFYRQQGDMLDLTMQQIAAYEHHASERGLVWSR